MKYLKLEIDCQDELCGACHYGSKKNPSCSFFGPREYSGPKIDGKIMKDNFDSGLFMRTRTCLKSEIKGEL